MRWGSDVLPISTNETRLRGLVRVKTIYGCKHVGLALLEINHPFASIAINAPSKVKNNQNVHKYGSKEWKIKTRKLWMARLALS